MFVNACDDTGKTALMKAAMFNDPDVMKALLDAGADPNTQDGDGWTALMRAAMFNEPNGIMVLMEAGADVGAADSEGRTAIFYARGNDKLKGSEALMLMEDKSWR